jgi:Fic family protein
MSESNDGVVSFQWHHLVDLDEDDRSAASSEIPALVATWDQERSSLAVAEVAEFQERLRREWAIETGIIERIYTLDVGVTQTLIEYGIDVSLIPSDATDQTPEFVAGIIGDQKAAIDLLFMVVTANRALTTGFIKELHALMTRRQTHVDAVDQFGRPTRVELLHGEYKVWPNNPQRPDGTIHEYCPPEQVASEMDRLIELHDAHITEGVPADVEAAWLHHRFTQIHPFQDGNGRIARALASLVLIRAGWFPLVVSRDDRPRYIEALEQADSKSLDSLIEFFDAVERRSFVRALSIVEDVRRETERVDQVLDAIGDMFGDRDAQLQRRFDQAKVTAHSMWEIALIRVQEVAGTLEERIATPGANRQVFVDSGTDDSTDRRIWNRYQVVQSARSLHYFASPREHHEWVRLCLSTESGRSELLLSFHGIGQVYRGVIGASMSFYRREEADDIEHQIVGHETVCDEVFQINYNEEPESVERRFRRWLEGALVRGLEAWRRSE